MAAIIYLCLYNIYYFGCLTFCIGHTMFYLDDLFISNRSLWLTWKYEKYIFASIHIWCNIEKVCYISSTTSILYYLLKNIIYSYARDRTIARKMWDIPLRLQFSSNSSSTCLNYAYWLNLTSEQYISHKSKDYKKCDFFVKLVNDRKNCHT
jgi:hypothetical protein